MRWTRAVSMVAGVWGLGASLLAAQGAPQKNALEGDPVAIKAGMGLFRGKCADCHGVDARGIRGPDITHVWAEGRTDGGLFETLRNGVPNTEMPSVGPLHERWGRSRSQASTIWRLPWRRVAVRFASIGTF